MNRISKDMILSTLIILSLIAAFFLTQDWLLYLTLPGLFILIWLKGRQDSRWAFSLLCAGEVCTVATWYASPWLCAVAQSATIGLYLDQVHHLSSVTETRIFIAFSACIFLAAGLIDLFNHTVYPVILILTGAGIFLLAALIAEFRLKKKYAGDHS